MDSQLPGFCEWFGYFGLGAAGTLMFTLRVFLQQAKRSCFSVGGELFSSNMPLWPFLLVFFLPALFLPVRAASWGAVRWPGLQESGILGWIRCVSSAAAAGVGRGWRCLWIAGRNRRWSDWPAPSERSAAPAPYRSEESDGDASVRRLQQVCCCDDDDDLEHLPGLWAAWWRGWGEASVCSRRRPRWGAVRPQWWSPPPRNGSTGSGDTGTELQTDRKYKFIRQKM